MSIVVQTRCIIIGPTRIWTAIAGFRVQSANRYTIGPLSSMKPMWKINENATGLQRTSCWARHARCVSAWTATFAWPRIVDVFCPHPSQQVGFPIAVHISANEKSKERCQGHKIKRRVRIVMNTSLSFHFPFQYLTTLFMGHLAQVFGTRHDEIYGIMGANMTMITNRQKQTHQVQWRSNKQ